MFNKNKASNTIYNTLNAVSKPVKLAPEILLTGTSHTNFAKRTFVDHYLR